MKFREIVCLFFLCVWHCSVLIIKSIIVLFVLGFASNQSESETNETAVSTTINSDQNYVCNFNPNSNPNSSTETTESSVISNLFSSNTNGDGEAGSTDIAPNSTALYDEDFKQSIESFRVRKNDKPLHHVRCKICLAYPNTVKMFSENNKLPPIVTAEGVKFRKATVEQHFKSNYHAECKKAQKLSVTLSNETNKNSIDYHIGELNKKLANRIGKLLIMVYGEVKKLTISARCWPAIFVSSEAANAFDLCVLCAKSS